MEANSIAPSPQYGGGDISDVNRQLVEMVSNDRRSLPIKVDEVTTLVDFQFNFESMIYTYRTDLPEITSGKIFSVRESVKANLCKDEFAMKVIHTYHKSYIYKYISSKGDVKYFEFREGFCG